LEIEIALLGSVPPEFVLLSRDVVEGYLGLKAQVVGFLNMYSSEERVLAYELLRRVREPLPGNMLLVITSKDIYHPGYNFLFGLALPGKRKAIVSFYRLLCGIRQIELERLAKEIVHELGHLMGLNHCETPGCVMRFSNSVFEVDEKDWRFCDRCLRDLEIRGFSVKRGYLLDITKYLNKR